ncbi:hypothetical protein [Solibacillus isronensis]|uniref:hypothetical protein n=1 Tax=Solibacillus isronensis TaxID=412383 RepID=UPI0039A393A5
MKKKQLIQLIQNKFDEEDAILIRDLEEIFEEENEQGRNEALLRALYSDQLEIDYNEDLEIVIRELAIRITQYIFRSGSIEDFHAGKYGFADYEKIPPNTPVEEISQLTDENMKVLNKELVDHIGFILHLFSRADYFSLQIAINGYKFFGDDWDDPEIEKIQTKHNDYLLLVTGLDDHLDNE